MVVGLNNAKHETNTVLSDSISCMQVTRIRLVSFKKVYNDSQCCNLLPQCMQMSLFVYTCTAAHHISHSIPNAQHCRHGWHPMLLLGATCRWLHQAHPRTYSLYHHAGTRVFTCMKGRNMYVRTASSNWSYSPPGMNRSGLNSTGSAHWLCTPCKSSTTHRPASHVDACPCLAAALYVWNAGHAAPRTTMQDTQHHGVIV